MEFYPELAIILGFVFLIGLCIGSFLNVVILRALSAESIVFPASKCPKCQTPLKWWHNIPVLSYVFLRGKCAFCKEKISIQYPIIELLTGVLFVAIALKFGFDVVNLFFWLIFASIFIVLSVTDIREKVVFDWHTFVLVGVGLVYNFFNIGGLYDGKVWIFNTSFVAALIGIVAGVLVMEILARFGYLVAGQRAFGEGDSYIAAGLGAIFGWKYLLTVLIYAVIVQVVLTLPMFLKKLWTQKDYKTLAAFLGFVAYVIIYKTAMYYSALGDGIIFLLFVIGLLALGIYTCKRILGGMKEPSGMTFLPFGPAMVVGALIVMFML